jgi:hypothetical protein
MAQRSEPGLRAFAVSRERGRFDISDTASPRGECMFTSALLGGARNAPVQRCFERLAPK